MKRQHKQNALLSHHNTEQKKIAVTFFYKILKTFPFLYFVGIKYYRIKNILCNFKKSTTMLGNLKFNWIYYLFVNEIVALMHNPVIISILLLHRCFADLQQSIFLYLSTECILAGVVAEQSDRCDNKRNITMLDST